MRISALLFSVLISVVPLGVAAQAVSPEALSEVHGDWRVLCVQRDGGRYCTASQVQTEPESGQRALAIELHRTAEGEVRGALALPFGLALQRGVRLSLDEQDSFFGDALMFSTCLPDGCVVPLRFDVDARRRLQAANALKIHAIAVSDGQRVLFEVSLKGVTAAISALGAR